jgi:YVTN family beta-propeller protein
MKKIPILLCSFVLLSLSFYLNAQTKSPQYAIVNKIHLVGDGGWDYLTADETTGRLYVSHSSMVQVVDTKTGSLAGTISNTMGVHGIALAPEFNKGFISNGGDASVTVFNLQTLDVIANVKVTGQNPDAILYDPYSKKVFTFNGRSSNATVIDAKTDSVIATIALAGKPEFAVSDNNGKIYVNIEDKNLISVIYVKELQVGNNWNIKPGEEASGLAIDNKTHRLFSVCRNKMMVVINAENGQLITTLPIGERCDGAKFDPGNRRAYSSNGDGTLTVMQEEDNDKYSVVENVTTQLGARTLAVDLKTHHIFLSTAEFGATPEATTENPRPRRSIQPGTFVVLEVAPVK